MVQLQQLEALFIGCTNLCNHLPAEYAVRLPLPLSVIFLIPRRDTKLYRLLTLQVQELDTSFQFTATHCAGLLHQDNAMQQVKYMYGQLVLTSNAIYAVLDTFSLTQIYP